MDTRKVCKIPKCGSLPDLSHKKLVVGAKQLRKAIQAGRAQQVFLAENADPAITEPLGEMCSNFNIHLTWVRTMAELGSVCGIEVGAAAAAVVD